MTFNDDEQIYGIQNGAAGFENEVTVGNAKVKIINVPDAPPGERKLKVLVELTGKGKPRERDGLDLVIVLDISENMNRQDRLEKLKKATEFVIKSLGPVDRVSVVTFSNVANRLCALRQINKESRQDIVDLVNGITSAGGANISEGLELALQVLSGRKFVEGRSVGIILLSSGEQDEGRNAAEVEMGNVPIYTFGFGTGNSPTMPHVLDAIAKKSGGGTLISDDQNTNDLRVAFGNCFSGLLTVAVKDLKLIMSPENMTRIENVYAGDHEQSADDSTVSVKLGNLYDNETRRVLVHVLPPVTSVVGLQVLKVAYRYRNEQGKARKSTPLFASKKRIENFTQEEIEYLMDEVIHLERARVMNEARALASINLPIGEENVSEESITPSSMVVAKGDVGNQKQAKSLQDSHTNILCAVEDIHVEQKIITSFEVTASVEAEKLPLVSTPCIDIDDKQADSFDKIQTNSLPGDDDNVQEETTSPPRATDENKIHPNLASTDENNLKDRTITTPSKVAARGYVGKMVLFFTKFLTFFNLHKLIHNEVESFEKDTTTSLSMNEEKVNDENIQPTSKGRTSGDSHKKQPESSDQNRPNILSTDEEDLKDRTSKTPSKFAARSCLKKLVLLFTKLFAFFYLHNGTHQEVESLEKEQMSSLPTSEENANEETTQLSSKVPTSGYAHHKEAESSNKNHPSLLPTDEDDLKDRTFITPIKVAARSYTEKLILLFTKLITFFYLRYRTHQEGDLLEKDHLSSLPTNEENVNEKNNQPSSKVVTSNDAHHKQAGSSDKNHHNLVTMEDNLKDRNITTPFMVAARGYTKNLLLLFTPRIMDTNQKQEGSFQKDCSSLLSTDEHSQKEHRDILSRATGKFIGTLAGISNGDALRSQRSEFKTIIKFALFSVAAATVSYMLCVCFSNVEFRDLAPRNILNGFGLYNPFWLLDIAILYILVLLVGAYQAYHQPLFEFVDKHAARIFPNNDFINKKYHISLPRGFGPFKLNLFRLVWRTTFMIITTVILMLIPFFNDVVCILGAFGFWPLTVYFLVEMYVVKMKIPKWSSIWICLQILSVACLIIATAAAVGSFSAVVSNLKVYRPFQTSY
ncbi:hypothetical protein POM88_037268 [Heracleum sosnowskyi]|uniref:VWFA domain-containing protein n=1 Tax=Heracleum sosnowskyi TaxID=360622 RepID=A0AAD8MF36_9APIA|nr:hypothetical protein POM88_037268 [Heracleum sosnowskyi]